MKWFDEQWRDVTRRDLLRTGLAAGAAIPAAGLLQACGGDDDDISPTGGAGGKVEGTIRFEKGPFTSDPKGELELINQVNGPFLKQNPGAEIKTTYYDWENFQTTLTTQFAGDNPPDVPYLTAAVWPNFASQGALRDLSELVDADDYKDEYAHILPALQEGGQLDGKTYALPWVGGTFPLFVNLDLFEEAGVSPDEFNQSYESLHEAASKLRKGNVFGYGQSISYKDFSYQAWLPYIWGAGADVFNEDGTAGAMDTPDAAASWDFVRSLYADDLAPRPGAYDQSGLQGLFASGRLAIYPTSMGLAQTVAAGKKKINWDIFAAPPGPTGEAPLPLDYGYLTVAAKAANPDAAWAYVKHLISPDPLTEYLNTLNIGFLSPRDDTPEVNASEPRFLKAQEEFVPSGRPYPTHPKTLDALRAGCDQFELCIAGEKSGADAVRDANEAITNLLSS